MKYTYMIDMLNTTTVFSIHDGHEYTTTNMVAMVSGDKLTFDENDWFLWQCGRIVTNGSIRSLHSERNYNFKVDGVDYTNCNFTYTAYDRISV